MNKKRMLLNGGILFFLSFFLYALHVYGPLLRTHVSSLIGQTEVKGVSTEALQEVSVLPFARRLKTDVEDSITAVKHAGLEVTIGEILQTVGRAKKISDDVSGVQEVIKEKLRDIAKQ